MKLSLSSLRALGLRVKIEAGHAFIKAPTDKQHEVWMASRAAALAGKGSLIYTKFVQVSIRGVE